MATTKEYLAYVLEQLADLNGISYRAMMGEYVLYYQGKIAGGIYDNRLLIKPVEAAVSLLPDAPLEEPYHGAKKMLLVDRLEDRQFLAKLFDAMLPQLPEPKKKKK